MSAGVFDPERFDPKDPDPWLALYLDQSLPIDEEAKRALLIGNRSVSRRWLFPIARPLILAFFIVVKILARAVAALAQLEPAAARADLLGSEAFRVARGQHPDPAALHAGDRDPGLHQGQCRTGRNRQLAAAADAAGRPA